MGFIVMNEFKRIDQTKLNKMRSSVNKHINNQNRFTCCEYCGKELKEKRIAFHKSHNVPLFCLENIKGEYMNNIGVIRPNYIFRTVFDNDPFIGIGKAGVFYALCSECDNHLFKCYESEERLLLSEPLEIMDQIALKIYLNELSKSRIVSIKSQLRYVDISDDELIASFFASESILKASVVDIDIRDYENDLDYAKRSLKNNYHNYRVLFHKIVDYTVPIAGQVSIPISRNIDFSEIQNVSSGNPSRIEDLIIGVLPLKEKSVIIMFTRLDNKKIKKYIKLFNKLSENDKLREIFYLLIRYRDTDYFFSPLIREKLQDASIREIYSIEDNTIRMNGFSLSFSDCENQKLRFNVPSLLSEEFSMQRLRINNTDIKNVNKESGKCLE